MLRAALLAAVLQSVVCKHVSVDLNSDRTWQFIGWFTYDKVAPHSAEYSATTFSWRIEGREGHNAVEMRLYNDMAISWGVVGPMFAGERGLSDTEVCLQSGECTTNVSCLADYHHEGRVSVPDKLRPRVWYAYVASLDCNRTIGTGGRVVVDFKNAGGFFTAEFGVDQQWVTETLIAACAVCTSLLVGYLTAHHREEGETEADVKLHPVMKHFVGTVVLQITAYLFLLCDYVNYASTGQENNGLKVAGQSLDILATLMLLLLIVIFAMGFKVVEVVQLRNQESVQKRRKTLAIFMAVMLALHIILIIAQTKMSGWSTQYPYATWPGFLLAALRVPVLAYFLWTLKATHEFLPHEERTRPFYTCAGVFAAQIATLPAMLIVALLVDPWVRFKVVFMSDTLLRVISIITMAALLWPGKRSRAILAAGYEHVPRTFTDDVEALDMHRSKSGKHDENEDEDEGL